MLNTISWNDFLAAMASLITFYYMVLVLTVFRHDIAQWIRHRRTRDQADTPPAILSRVDPTNGETQNLDYTHVDASEIIVDQLQSTSARAEQYSRVSGTVSDLLEEIKELARALAGKGDRDECVTMFRTLLQRYPDLKDSHVNSQITQAIRIACRDTCDFEFRLSDIQSWWTTPGTQLKSNS